MPPELRPTTVPLVSTLARGAKRSLEARLGGVLGGRLVAAFALLLAGRQSLVAGWWLVVEDYAPYKG